MTSTEFHLAERLSTTSGMITLSGAQALLRVPVDQHRVDAAKGLDTATLVSGYRGSPLGGIEGIIAQHRAQLDAANVQFISGVNEELAATAIWGSQMAELEADARYDGVKGIWYGKGPGVDRSGDAFRHANFAGVGRFGGVLALAGDDPECKSSTIPSASEFALTDAGMPVLYPGDVGDVLRLGRFGFELSRASGLWVGVKVHTDVADGFATIPATAGDVEVVDYVHEVNGRPWRATVDNNLLAPQSLHLEEELFGVRQEAALGFVRENAVDRTFGAHDAWLGIVVAGKPLGDVRDALGLLGIADSLADVGVKLYVPGMISPLEPRGLRSFAAGLETLLVVEAKRPFIESQVRDLLYAEANRPTVLGKRDVAGQPLVPLGGALSPDVLVEPLRRVLQTRVDPSRLRKPRERIPLLADPGLPRRTPYYCSGCPHNRSTVVPEGSIAAGGIGCHSMVLWMDRRTDGLTQMGGEGAQWVGTAPFVDANHRFQNLGDGTFFHSGSLAIRQAVSAGTDITFKLLYNGVVAMTGGQEAAGEVAVPELTRWLDAEGVVQTVVVTDDVGKYGRSAEFAAGCRVVDRSELDEVQRELREIPGVTALVYDQGCAADLRRSRKREVVKTPTTRVMINEAICEGCGHCGEISNCMSVHPVETPFGRKTQIHQESCNFDYSCVDGNCPAFVTVEIDENDRVEAVRAGGDVLQNTIAPAEPDIPERSTLLIVGIGGTGVVTVSQVLSTAAMLDGKVATSLDQTGLAQKGGQVVSNLHIAPTTHEGAAKLGSASADALLLFDVVGGATTAVLERGRADSTVAVVSTSRVPTGEMVSRIERERFPEIDAFKKAIDRSTDPSANVWLDAEAIARHVFGSQPAANLLVMGVAYQRALVPVGAESIEKAIELNGVAVETNLEAFRLGRRLAADDALAAELAQASARAAPRPPEATREVLELLDLLDDLQPELETVLLWRLPELIAWGGSEHARRYVDEVAQIRSAEQAVGGSDQLTTVVARQLCRLMTFKDEYEVARLALDADMEAVARQRFGPNAKVSYQLKPPTLKRVGVDRKIAVPSGAAVRTFKALRKAVGRRGTRLDPFGRTEERRVERELIAEYIDLLDVLRSDLTSDNLDEAVALAGLVDQVRGFDEIKLANVERYRGELAPLLAQWRRSSTDRKGLQQ